MQIANLGLKEWYNTPADMWAAGCVLAEMIESVPAFPASSGVDLLHRITCLLGRPDAKTWNMGHFKINTQLSSKSRLSTSFEQLVPRGTQSQRDLLRKLLVWDPRDRLSAKAALKHFIFDDVPDVVTWVPSGTNNEAALIKSADSSVGWLTKILPMLSVAHDAVSWRGSPSNALGKTARNPASKLKPASCSKPKPMPSICCGN